MKSLKVKFNIGDRVSHPPDLYGNRESVVISVERIFSPGRGELTTCESRISSIRSELNPRIENIDGVDYFLHDGDKSCGLSPTKAPFVGWVITTKNSDMNTMWNQESLMKIS